MIKYLLTGVMLIIILANGLAMADVSEKENAALGTAKAWLQLIEAERYVDSWKEAADYFKSAVNQKQWE
jgi:hypothetical protein